jgi:hypothetical protein
MNIWKLAYVDPDTGFLRGGRKEAALQIFPILIDESQRMIDFLDLDDSVTCFLP